MILALWMVVGTGKDLFLGRLVDKGSITVFTEFKVLYLGAIWILEHRILASISSQGESSGRFPERSPDATVFAAFMHTPRGNAGPQTPIVSICYQSLGSGRGGGGSIAARFAVVPPSHLRYCRPLPSPGRSRVARPLRPWDCRWRRQVWRRAAEDPELQGCPGSCGGHAVPEREGPGGGDRSGTRALSPAQRRSQEGNQPFADLRHWSPQNPSWPCRSPKESKTRLSSLPAQTSLAARLLRPPRWRSLPWPPGTRMGILDLGNLRSTRSHLNHLCLLQLLQLLMSRRGHSSAS